MSGPSLHRQSSRRLICIPVLFVEEGKSTFSIDYSTDLSEGGVLIQTEQPSPVGARLDLKFRLPNSIQLIRVKGEVVWSHPHIPGQSELNLIPGMGVRFLDLDPPSRRYLTTYIQRSREEASIPLVAEDEGFLSAHKHK